MTQQDFLQALLYARILHLYYHNCHNLTYGATFEGDHELFNDFYNEMSEHYDRLAEYMIAELSSQQFETKFISETVNEELQKYEVEKMSADIMFEHGLLLEGLFQQSLILLDSAGSLGIKNMVGDLAEKSDVRRYKIKQRLK